MVLKEGGKAYINGIPVSNDGRSLSGFVMNRRLLLFWECVLLIASVFVFRGLWLLLDSLEFMHQPAGLWLSLILGSAVTVWAIHCITRHEKK
jgi:hypothetical protein